MIQFVLDHPGEIRMHMVLDLIAGLIMTYALARCKHWTHRVARWTILAFIFSVATVWLVG